jgi:hypothetical protein
MKQLTLTDARRLIQPGPDYSATAIPAWFTSDMIQYLFPLDHRPASVPILTPPSSSGEGRTSARRDEDESRRKAMHSLVTNWDKSARTVAKQLVDVLFRGSPPPVKADGRSFGTLALVDEVNVSRFASLIPDSSVDVSRLIASLSTPCPQFSPVSSIGGYTVTETVGPLAMLSRICRTRERVSVWTKDKVCISHGRRRVRINRREGRVVMFDRQMNIVFIPSGNAADNWQFFRGHVIVLVQSLHNTSRSLQSTPSSSSSSSSSSS